MGSFSLLAWLAEPAHTPTVDGAGRSSTDLVCVVVELELKAKERHKRRELTAAASPFSPRDNGPRGGLRQKVVARSPGTRVFVFRLRGRHGRAPPVPALGGRPRRRLPGRAGPPQAQRVRPARRRRRDPWQLRVRRSAQRAQPPTPLARSHPAAPLARRPPPRPSIAEC